MTIITQDLVREYFDYDPKTGHLIWKKKVGSSGKGSIAGHIAKSPRGYRFIRFFGKLYCAHRLVWFYVYGEFPKKVIDHINHDQSDNRIENLRNASVSENAKNMRKSKNNKSGVTGVSWNKERKKWVASIGVTEQKKHMTIPLGRFVNKKDAIAARKQAEKLYGYHENHGKAA